MPITDTLFLYADSALFHYRVECAPKLLEHSTLVFLLFGASSQTALVVVAINKNCDAPIFGVADFGIVGDPFDVAPHVIDEIERVQSER
jgi:hypothetical protein